MKRRILSLVAIMLSLCLGVSAQQQRSNRSADGKILRGPYLTNNFFDNMFLGGSVGSFLYFGELNEGGLMDRAVPVYGLSVGSWLTPSVGVRLKGDFAYEAYQYSAKYRSPYTYAISEQGWSMNRFNYLNVHADFMWNLSNVLGGYRSDRVYEAVPYLGFGYSYLWRDDLDCESGAISFTVGMVNKFRLSRTVDLNLELGAVAVDGRLDRSTANNLVDLPLSASLGVSIKLGKNREFRRASEVSVPVDVSAYNEQLVELSLANQELINRNEELAKELESRSTPSGVVVKSRATPVALFFELGAAELDEGQLLNLDFYVRNAMEVDRNKVFRLTASADSQTGSSKRNMELSEARMNYVASLLMGKYGISIDRLELRSDGDSNNRYSDAELNRAVILE